MDFSILKFPGRGLEEIESLQQLRHRLLTFLMYGGFIPATAVYLLAMIPVFQKGLSVPPLVYTVLYIWYAIIAFGTRIPYPLRGVSWSLIFLLFGLVNLSLSGLNVDSGLFFITYILMTCLFFDLKQGLVALGVSALCVAIFGYLVVNGIIGLNLALPQTAPMLWVIGGMILVSGAAMLILPLIVLMRGLVGFLEKARAESVELERTNQALRSSEERYRSLVEISPDMMALIDLQGNLLLTNEPDVDFYGYSSDDLIGSNLLAFIAPEDQPIVLEAFQKTLEAGSAREVICRCVRKDGTEFDTEFNTNLVRDREGKPESVVVVGRDITDRRNVERALKVERVELETQVVQRTSELHIAQVMLEDLVTRSPAVIYTTGLAEDSGITYLSQNIRDYLGYSPEDFISDRHFWRSCLHPDDQVEYYSQFISRMRETGEGVLEYRIRHKNGDYRWVRDSARFVTSPDGEPIGIVGACIDITDLKRTEESYRTLVDKSVQGIAVYQDERIVYGNQRMADSFGIPLDELKSLTTPQLIDFLHPDDQEMVWSRYQSRQGGITDNENHEIRIQVPNGEIRYLVVSISPITYEAKPALQISAFDMTERRKIEQAMHESEETERAILNATTESLVLVDPDQVVVAMNQSANQFTGLQPDEMLGASLRSLFPAELARVSVHFDSVIEYGESVNFEGAYKGFLFDINLYPLFDDYGQVARVLIAARDISEQRRMEKALRENEETGRVILNSTDDSLILLDSDEVVLAANQISAERLGKRAEDLLGVHIPGLFPEEVSKKRSARFKSVMETGEPLNYEETFNDRIFDVNLYPIFNDYGQVTRVLISGKDVTERRKMEKALRESEQTLRAMINATPASLAMLDKDGTFLAANGIAAERLGLKLDDMLGKSAYLLFPEEIARVRKAYIDEVFASGVPVTFEDIREDYWFENHIYPVTNDQGGVTRVVVSARDLTGRKKMEQALRASEETLRIMMNATPTALGMLDADKRLMVANTALINRLGVGMNEALGRTMHQLLPREAAASRKSHVDQVFRTGQPTQFEDSRDGKVFENHVYPIKNDEGQVTRVVFSAIDLTERMLIEQSLKADKEELEARVANRTRELSESREQLRTLTKEVVASQEEERRKISRELHDEAGQALVSMKYSLESIIADLHGDHQPIRERLAAAVWQVDETMEQIRFLAHSLRPPLLDIADLDLTLRDYCSEFSESTKLQVDYIGASLPSLTDQAELAFFRFLQEAMTNVAKHARATRVRVRLKKYSDHLSLLVVDNGVGAKDSKGLGQGHLGMQERFRVLGGQVRLRRGIGDGFVVLASVPLRSVLKDEQQGM